ncbi:hypothetical protein V2J09_023265 [Rumex salicifolius]
MATSTKVVVGSHVWVEDPEVTWIDGDVTDIKEEKITVICTSGKTVTINASNIHIKDTEAPSTGVDDMTKLAYLHEPGVLENLKRRYDTDEIYTYTGSILIAVNPFKRLPHLYEVDVMEKYKGSTKMLMRYLAFMGGRSASVGEGRSVEQQVLESNPVLEAFGNAKTVRNNNSSRFGKFVELQFDQRGRISGAAIRTYLLERSRVCQVSDPERNYHCFYMLCAAPPDVVQRFKLGNPRDFHYLNQSHCFELDALDDANEYIATRRAMHVVGINSDEQDGIFRVVAAILHLGNIEFKKGSEIDSSEPKDDETRNHLKIAADLFMCDEKALEDSLCKRVIVTRDESITKCLDPEAATTSRDALAKTVYSKLLVDKINSSIGQDPNSKNLIGVLDIYGFESFKTNSFEQFCINLTNEKLQQHFNQHVFKMEQEEYTKEEIDWSYIEFIDNQDVLDLIEKKPGGIVALLDEACMFPKSTHETFAQKLYQTFNNNKRFSKPKLSRTDFTICHYAGDVTYQTENFLEKNKDYVVAEHQALLSSSRCPFVAGLFPPLPEDTSKSSKFSSIGSRFKQQLQSLLETLSSTEPHYVRCVKPNNLLKPSMFENSNVLQQLRCGGVMEAIRISCAGYPTRRAFNEFSSRFRVLAPKVVDMSPDSVTACKKLLEKVHLQGFQIGKTKVFLRAGQMAELDAARTEVLGRSATIIQRRVQTYYTRKKFIILQGSAIVIEAFIRGQLGRIAFELKRKEAASVKIQKESRRYLSRKVYYSALAIQMGIRGMAARIELHHRKKKKAATYIQSHWRGYILQAYYIRLKKATLVTQCAWRMKIARKELRKLKMAAKDTGLLQEAKSKLEKEVEDLNNRLQLEKRLRAESEEANTQEKAKMQQALEELQTQYKEMQIQAEETKAELVKECESARKAILDMPVQQEVPVLDEDMLNKIKAENEELKSLVNSLENKITESEKNCEETSNLNEQLKSLVDSLENKVSETEKVLEQTSKLSAENEQLKSLVNSLENKISETEKKFEETSILSAENEQLKSLVNSLENKISETENTHEETSKLSTENEQLKSLVNSLENKISETETKHEETSNLSAENKQLKSLVNSLENKISETEKTLETSKLSTENEQLKSLVNSLENKISETETKHEETSNLSAENEQLKSLVNSLENKISETEKKYEETSKLSDERLKQAQEAESKIFELRSTLQRMEVKIVNMESEDGNPRRRALANSSKGKQSGYLSTEDGDGSKEGQIPPGRFFGSESMRRSQAERQQASFNILIRCASLNVGFSQGKPVAAFTIYKCLLHWKCFEAEKTGVFDRLIQLIGSAFEKDDTNHLAYWLSNSSALLFLLQKSLKGKVGGSAEEEKPVSFFTKMAQALSSSNLPVDVVRIVEAKYPALLFRQQLSAYVETMYGMIRDNVRRQLSPILSSCIKGPGTPKQSTQNNEQSDVMAAPASHWKKIIDILSSFLDSMKKNFVPPLLVQRLLCQIFSYINAQLFNNLLLHRECCTFSHAEYVKSGLDGLSAWIEEATEEFAGSASDELKHIRQAVGFLVIHQKSRITYEDLTTDLCPTMNIQQLYRICTLYDDDDKVSIEVISSMKEATKDSGTDPTSDGAVKSYQLNDNSSIPFSIDDINNSMEVKDFMGMSHPPMLIENSGFQFLVG